MKQIYLIVVISILFGANLTAQTTGPDMKKLNVKAGLSLFNFSDPYLTGENSFFYTAGSGSGNYNGYRNFPGVFVKLSYYLNNNVGVFGDVSLQSKSVSYYVDPVNYENSADLQFIKLGVTGQIMGSDYPVRLNVGTGLAIGMYDLYHARTGVVGSELFLASNGTEAGVCFNAELTVPIYKSIHFVSQLEYLYIQVSELTFEHDGGSDYYQRYYDANIGGYSVKLGISVDIL